MICGLIREYEAPRQWWINNRRLLHPTVKLASQSRLLWLRIDSKNAVKTLAYVVRRRPTFCQRFYYPLPPERRGALRWTPRETVAGFSSGFWQVTGLSDVMNLLPGLWSRFLIQVFASVIHTLCVIGCFSAARTVSCLDADRFLVWYRRRGNRCHVIWYTYHWH